MRVWFFIFFLVSIMANGLIDRAFAKEFIPSIPEGKNRYEELSDSQQRAVDQIFEALPEGARLRDGGKVAHVDPEQGTISVVNAEGLMLTYDLFSSVLNGGDTDPPALIGCILMAWFPGAVVGCVVGLVLISVVAA